MYLHVHDKINALLLPMHPVLQSGIDCSRLNLDKLANKIHSASLLCSLRLVKLLLQVLPNVEEITPAEESVTLHALAHETCPSYG